jgi:hypothetical protein
MSRRKPRPSGGPCDLRLSGAEIAVLIAVRDAPEVRDRDLADRRTVARLLARGLLWRVDGEVGLTWGGIGWCGRVLEPVETRQ